MSLSKSLKLDTPQLESDNSGGDGLGISRLSASKVYVPQGQYGELDNFYVIRTIGKGGFGKVKLGFQKETYQKVAIKICQKEDPKSISQFKKEAELMKEINQNENVIKLVSHGQGTYTTKKGNQKNVFYLVTELVTGGEFFDFISETGNMSEDEARFYFKQLLGGLAYLHKKQVFHRDLKLENLMLDENFNLKIIDFGLAHVKDSESRVKRTADGLLNEKCGTQGYQPPEMVLKIGYQPQDPDLFASAVILFIIVTGSPPFGDTKQQDPWYDLLIRKEFKRYWRAQTQDGTKVSDPLREMIQTMFINNPKERLQLKDLLQHGWTQGPLPNLQKLKKSMAKRKKNLDRQFDSQIDFKKIHKSKVHEYEESTDYKGLGGEEDEKKCEEYQVEFKTHTEFFTTMPPVVVWQNFNNFMNDQGESGKAYVVKTSEEQYKATFSWQHEVKMKDPDGNLSISQTVNLEGQMRILQVNEQDKVYCVQFSKVKGQSAYFNQMFNQIMTQDEGIFFGFEDVDRETLFPSPVEA